MRVHVSARLHTHVYTCECRYHINPDNLNEVVRVETVVSTAWEKEKDGNISFECENSVFPAALRQGAARR